jgi:hypothetical protein
VACRCICFLVAGLDDLSFVLEDCSTPDPLGSIIDAAMPYSVPGSGIPKRPIMPPRAITIGNATGRSQIAGEPSCAPHIIANT